MIIPLFTLFTPFEKGFVHATSYTNKQGKPVHRKAYTDKRIAKKVVAKDKIRTPWTKDKTYQEVKEKLHTERDSLKKKLEDVRAHKEELLEAKKKGYTHTKRGIKVDHEHHLKTHEKNIHEKLETTNHKIMLHASHKELLREKIEETREKAREKRKATSKEFKNQSEYMDWYRKQSTKIKDEHKLNKTDGKLIASWGKPSEKKPLPKKAVVVKDKKKVSVPPKVAKQKEKDIKFYTRRLEKVKDHWGGDNKSGSMGAQEKGPLMIKYAQAQLDAVKNGKSPFEVKLKEEKIVVPKEKEIDYSKIKVGREDYKERKEAKIDRLRDRAEKAQSESDSRYKSAKQTADMIPFGQPILVGHHSEGRARRDQQKIHDNMGRSIKAQEKAGRLSDRADSAENNRSISSDDPEAAVKLKQKLDNLEKLQAKMKEINAAYRKFKKNPATLDKSGLEENHKKTIRDFVPQYSWEKGPFPSYRMTNNNATIRNTKKRLDGMVASSGAETKTLYEKGDIKVVDNVEDNRIQVHFPDKPDEATRKALKSNGFKWAPSVGVWQRKRSPNARFSTKYLIKELESMSKSVAIPLMLLFKAV